MRADPNPFTNPLRALGRASFGALLLAVAGNAASLPGRRFVGQYDFGYAMRGDRAARLAQVFDDGSGKVYFEARPNQPMPAVFAGKDLTLLVMQPEGQYFTARTAASEFTLVLGGARAVVRRGDAALGEEIVVPRDEGPGRQLASADQGLTPGVDYAALPSRFEHEQPVVFAPGSATLRPEVLDALTALVVRIGHDTAIHAVGRNDAGVTGGLAALRAQALRNALLARGVPARAIQLVDDGGASSEAHPAASALRWTSVAPGRESTPRRPSFDVAPLPMAPYASQASGSAVLGQWSVLVQDITLARTLERWGAQAGYRVKWDAQRNFLIGAPDSIDGSFETALKTLLNSAGIRQSDYPLEACIYANTPPLVRITRQGEQARECDAQ